MVRYVAPLVEKLGIPSIHWHAFRHLNNRIMLDEGVDVKTRMDRMGHVSERVNLIYTFVEDMAQRDAAKLIWQTFPKAAQKQTENGPVSLKVAEGRGMELSEELVY